MKKFYLLFVLFTGACYVADCQASIATMPNDPNECFEAVSVKYCKKINTLSFPFVQATFVTKATYKARYEKASVHGGAKTEVSIQIANLTDADYQEITNEIAKIVEKKFSEGGYTVIGMDKINETTAFNKMLSVSEKPGTETKIPSSLGDRLASGATHIKTFTATGRPVYSPKTAGMNLYKLSKESKAGQGIISYVIDFSTSNVEKEKKYEGDKIITGVLLEAIPVVSLNGEISLSDYGKTGGVRNKKAWGSNDNFVLESKKIDDNTYELKVDTEIYKKAVLSLVEANLGLAVQYFQSIRK